MGVRVDHYVSYEVDRDVLLSFGAEFIKILKTLLVDPLPRFSRHIF